MLKEEVEFVEDLQNRILILEEKMSDFSTWDYIYESLKNMFNYIELIDRRSKDQGKRIRKLGKKIKEIA